MVMRRRPLRPWARALATLALIGGPVLVYALFPSAGIPAATAAGVVAVVVITHLGLLAVLLAPIYTLFRRRAKQRQRQP